MIEKRKGICIWTAVEGLSLRLASTPSRRANRNGQRVPDQPISEPAIAFQAMILKPTGMGGVSTEIFCRHAMVLTADHRRRREK
jgi:hypothetical protein